jgi:hypothetical protein
MVQWRCGWKHLHRHNPFTQHFYKRMRISRHFLIPFFGVSVIGSAVLLVATRSGLDDVSSTGRPGERVESTIREQAGGHQFPQDSIPAVSLDDKSSPAAFDQSVDQTSEETVSIDRSSVAKSREPTKDSLQADSRASNADTNLNSANAAAQVSDQGNSGGNLSLSNMRSDVGGAVAANRRSDVASSPDLNRSTHQATGSDATQTQSSDRSVVATAPHESVATNETAATSFMPATNTIPSDDSAAAVVDAAPSLRGSPFTPEEEQYRLWHGWASIDTFRAAQNPGHP